MQKRFYYQPSGLFSAPGALIAFLLATLISLIAAIIYACSVVYIPFPKVNSLLCLCFGSAMGVACALFMQQPGKVRNRKLTMILTLIVSAVGYYVCWVVWVWISMNRVYSDQALHLRDLAGKPRMLFDTVHFINANGTWRMSQNDSTNMAGVALSFIWLGEALLIFASSLFFAYILATSTPFCEKCGQWCNDVQQLRDTDAVDDAALRRHLEEGDFAFIAALPAPVPSKSVAFRFTRVVCAKCKEFGTINVSRITESEATVIKHLRVTPADVKAMMPTPK